MWDAPYIPRELPAPSEVTTSVTVCKPAPPSLFNVAEMQAAVAAASSTSDESEADSTSEAAVEEPSVGDEEATCSLSDDRGDGILPTANATVVVDGIELDGFAALELVPVQNEQIERLIKLVEDWEKRYDTDIAYERKCNFDLGSCTTGSTVLARIRQEAAEHAATMRSVWTGVGHGEYDLHEHLLWLEDVGEVESSPEECLKSATLRIEKDV